MVLSCRSVPYDVDNTWLTNNVNKVKFNPMHPHLLYASQRRSDSIYCWDVREPFEVIQTYTRKARSTNQKLLFDIDPTGRWLITGDEVTVPIP